MLSLLRMSWTNNSSAAPITHIVCAFGIPERPLTQVLWKRVVHICNPPPQQLVQAVPLPPNPLLCKGAHRGRLQCFQASVRTRVVGTPLVSGLVIVTLCCVQGFLETGHARLCLADSFCFCCMAIKNLFCNQ